MYLSKVNELKEIFFEKKVSEILLKKTTTKKHNQTQERSNWKTTSTSSGTASTHTLVSPDKTVFLAKL